MVSIMNLTGRIALISFCMKFLAMSDALLSRSWGRGKNCIVLPRSNPSVAPIRLSLVGVAMGDDDKRLPRRARDPIVIMFRIFDKRKLQEKEKQEAANEKANDSSNSSRRISAEENYCKYSTKDQSMMDKDKETTNMALPLLCSNGDIYIRHIQEKDLKDASRILTNAFFSFPLFTSPLEWLKTYLSLQDSFQDIELSKQKKNKQGSSPDNKNNQIDDYIMLVACETKNDAVVGICELDGRSRPLSTLKHTPRPYICNLAVDDKYRQRGIGKAFVGFCEGVAREEWMESYLYLKVRVGNDIAMGMYMKLGYCVIEEGDVEDKETVVLLQKMLHCKS